MGTKRRELISIIWTGSLQPLVSFDEYQIPYLYDAAGNKTQKQVETFVCPPNTQCPPHGTATTDYLRMRMGHGQRYTQMYTTKELQTGEYWDASVSTGLEMYDFDARFYDPQLGRWFVGDPAEQFHNPYLAMGNNPVVYVDPDGEFVGTVITAVYDFWRIGLTEGGFEFWNWGSKNFRDAWREFDPTAEWSRTNKAFKVDLGLFKTDPEKDFFGRAWELISRFTWQLPQAVLGNGISHGINISGNVNDVNYFGGATVLDTEIKRGAFTVGSYITGPRGFKPDFRDHLFVHEYGHYRQSQRLGPFYLSTVALPSLTDAGIDKIFGTDLHDTRWYEAQASRLGADYFDEHYGSGAEGYTSGSPDYFDRNSFVNEGVFSPYRNPRNGRLNYGGNPLKSKFHWTDIPINLLYNGGYGLFGFFF